MRAILASGSAHSAKNGTMMVVQALKALTGSAPRARAAYGEAQRYYRETVLAYDGDYCLLWPFNPGPDGYGMVNGKQVHRQVCEAVHGAPPTGSHQAAHLCGKGHLGCVSPRHLSWKTPKENMADTLVHGTRNRGSRNGFVRLSEAQVREIKALKGVVSARKRAKRFRVGHRTVRDIDDNKTWSWLDAANA